MVLSYGMFYGAGTYSEKKPPKQPGIPQVDIDRAAERTVELLGAPSGVVVITD